jgi:hypothetical protein
MLWFTLVLSAMDLLIRTDDSVVEPSEY